MATYGIDLGTTNSCIAYLDESSRPVILKSAMGEDTTPSVVYFESAGNVVIGQGAKESAKLAPAMVVELVKRKMGQDITYSFHGRNHSPQSVSALILRELTRAAGEQTGEEVHDVVITVPAYFGLLEREATRKAGQIAGLNVLDVLDEPVAAAVAYQALGEKTGVRHILVYDLGGGTFDTTVIRIDGGDIRVVCTDGDKELGGADWDNKIIDLLLRSFTDQYPQLDPRDDEHFMQDLSTSAEQLKRSLSNIQARKYHVRFDGSVVPVELTREQLEELTSELLERTMVITERTIATAREQGVEGFDDVLLVGGMTITPAITQALKERFGLDARLRDPHLAVAKGAALYAQIKMAQKTAAEHGDSQTTDTLDRVAEKTGTDRATAEILMATRVATVVPRAFGVMVLDSNDPLAEKNPKQARHYVEHLLTANTPLPADTGPQDFRTARENQQEVRIEVWEQAGAVASEELEHNTHIGEGMLSDLPRRPAKTRFQIDFHMSEMLLLTVHGHEPGSGSEVRFEIQIGNLDEAATQQATDVVKGYEVSG